MIIVSGALHVAPDDRTDYLSGCEAVVDAARRSAGCLDFALSADILDAGRINVYERWETDDDVTAFRGSGPSDEQQAQILDASVHKYRISAVEAP